MIKRRGLQATDPLLSQVSVWMGPGGRRAGSWLREKGWCLRALCFHSAFLLHFKVAQSPEEGAPAVLFSSTMHMHMCFGIQMFPSSYTCVGRKFQSVKCTVLCFLVVLSGWQVNTMLCKADGPWLFVFLFLPQIWKLLLQQNIVIPLWQPHFPFWSLKAPSCDSQWRIISFDLLSFLLYFVI